MQRNCRATRQLLLAPRGPTIIDYGWPRRGSLAVVNYGEYTRQRQISRPYSQKELDCYFLHPFSRQVHIANASRFGVYKCKAVNLLGVIERVLTLRPGLKPATPSLSLLLPQPALHSTITNDYWKEDVLSVAVDSHSNAIYLNLSLSGAPLNVTEMDATGFRVQYISRDNYTKANRTWTHAEFADFVYRADGGPHILQNLTWNQIYLLRASTKNVAGFSDFSEPFEFSLSPSLYGHNTGAPFHPPHPAGVSLVSLAVTCILSIAFTGPRQKWI